MIQAQSLTKHYGIKTAVDAVDFTVQPGKVTGCLGQNGAGKSTTMRMIVGLDRPSAGSVIVNGKPYHEHKAPLREVGVMLDAKAVHTGRSAYNHLRAMAATHDIPTSRVHEVINRTGLESVARKRVGGFSLGMGQRLGIAAALLGDPATLILDEPVNGLDPERVQWVRTLTKQLAAEGRTVLLSSHLMSEMALTADHIIVLGRGRVIADASVDDIIASAAQNTVRVRTPHSAALAALLAQEDVTITNVEQDVLEISGLTVNEIGDRAAAAQISLHELSAMNASLEDAYMKLTQNELEYRTGDAQLTRERDQQAQLARISERTRIAGEMHDVVAHSLSVMVALADGAHAIAPKDVERSRAAMLDVAATGRRSMTEMRRLLGVLEVETEPAPRAPQPGIDQLADLVESFRSTGLPVVLERSGREPSNASVQLTIFRLIQASLTNVLRYADTPTRVTVRLASSPGTAQITISDNGRPAAASVQGFGRGLIGMQERVAIYGGIFEAAPGLHDGWRVHATLRFEDES